MNWSNETVLVTGGHGFLGSYVKALIEEKGATVLAPRQIDYDFRHESDVFECFQDSKPTIVIHLAANLGGIGANAANPATFFTDNVLMNTLVLQQAQQSKVKKFIGIGSICAYPKFTPVPFRENCLWDGYPEETNAPYGMAKRMLLIQCQAYRAQYGLNAIYLMPTNLYGAGDNFDSKTSHVIPAIIRKCGEAIQTQADSITLWGDGTPTREFLHVQDAAQGIILAAEHYNSGDPVNLGVGYDISIADLARMIADRMGFKGTIHWDTSKPNGQPLRMLDTSKARLAFGFEAQIDFSEGLTDTIDWYLKEKAVTI